MESKGKNQDENFFELGLEINSLDIITGLGVMNNYYYLIISSISKKTTKIYKIMAHKPIMIRQIDSNSTPRNITFSDDCKKVVLWNKAGLVDVLDLKEGKRNGFRLQNKLTSVLVYPENLLLLFGTHDKGVSIRSEDANFQHIFPDHNPWGYLTKSHYVLVKPDTTDTVFQIYDRFKMKFQDKKLEYYRLTSDCMSTDRKKHLAVAENRLHVYNIEKEKKEAIIELKTLDKVQYTSYGDILVTSYQDSELKKYITRFYHCSSDQEIKLLKMVEEPSNVDKLELVGDKLLRVYNKSLRVENIDNYLT